MLDILLLQNAQAYSIRSGRTVLLDSSDYLLMTQTLVPRKSPPVSSSCGSYADNEATQKGFDAHRT